MSLANALSDRGWYAHQHPTDVVRCEVESIAAPSPLPPNIALRLARLSDTLSTAIAFLPQPDLRSHVGCVPSSPAGIRLPLPRDVPIPHESTLSWSSPESILPIWKQLLPEIVSGWAIISDPLAAALLFTGPKDRLCYWPRLLNMILLDIPVAYGSVWDLFTILAAFGLKIDLKAAFRSVMVDPRDWPLLGAVLDGLPITFTRLPFGLKSSPVIFVAILARTMTRIGASLPSTRAALSSFVDDVSSSAVDLLSFVEAAETIVHALVSDGWWLSLSKIFLFPAIRLLYIGFTADFPRAAVLIAPSKLQKVIDLLCSIPVPPRDSVPADEQVDAASSRALRISASSTGVSVLHTSTSVPSPEFPRPPRVAQSVGITPPPYWPTHHPTPSVDSLIHSLLTLPPIPPSARQGSPPIISILCQGALIPDIISSLPSSITSSHAVMIIAVDQSPPPSAHRSWLEAALSDLSPAMAAQVMARLPPTADTPLPPQPTASNSHLSQDTWITLRRLLGTLAWWQSVFRWLGYVREPLDRTLNSARWSTASVDAVATLRDLISRFGSLSAPARRPSSPLVVIVDSSRAWGAVIPSRSSPPVFCAGSLPARVLGASSTVKEVWGARVATCRGMEMPGSSYDGVQVIVDSTATVGSANSGSSVAPVNEALAFFAVLQMAGLPVDWQWERRSVGWHPTTDAFSSLPQPWPLKRHVNLWISERFGPPTFLIGSSSDPSDPNSPCRYVTLRCGNVERDKVLQGINPAGSVGWLGPLGSVRIHPSERGFALPLWSQLPELWEIWSARPFDLTLIAPSTPALFWAPALARFQAAASASIVLPPDSLAPPIQIRSESAPDPRQLSAYQLHGAVAHTSRTPRDSSTRGGREAFARASPNATNPGPMLRPSRHDPWSGSAAAIPPTPRPAPPTAVTTRGATLPQKATTLTPRPSVPASTPAPSLTHPTIPSVQSGRTLGEWVGDVVKCMSTGESTDSAVHPRVRAAAAVHAPVPRSASSRPARAIEYLSTLIADARLGDVPFTLPNTQAVVRMFVNRRLENPPPFGWSLVENAATVAADCSAIAAASGRSGTHLPPFCGPSVRILLEEHKAFIKKDHSAAYPLPLDVLILSEPPSSQKALHMAWSALILMSFMCLRTGVLFHLTSQMFVPYARGWLLIWRHSHKRAGSAPNDPLFLSPAVMLAAARHHLLDRILDGRKDGPLFPGLSSDTLTTFIRTSIPGTHPAFDIRSYGARVAAVQDATILMLPGPLMRSLFWWKQAESPMSEYYAGTNILLMFAFSEARFLIKHTPMIPGYFAATLSAPSPNWSSVIVGDPPPLPSKPLITQMEAAWFATSPSFIAKRMQLAAYVIGRARQLQDRLLNCSGCKALVGVNDTAYLCDSPGCRWGLCPTCHPAGSDGTLLCPDHVL